MTFRTGPEKEAALLSVQATSLLGAVARKYPFTAFHHDVDDAEKKCRGRQRYRVSQT